ncbi:MPN499 family protein [Mycoplasma sp. 4423]
MKVKYIKINHMENGYWVVPPIWKVLTPKSRNFVIKHAKSLEDIIKYNQWENTNIIFSFNSDKDFYLFNKLMRIRGFDFQLHRNKVEKMDEQDYIDYQIIENLIIRFNIKTIKNLYYGRTFFFTKQYFEDFYQKNAKGLKILYVQWTRWGFEVLSNV